MAAGGFQSEPDGIFISQVDSGGGEVKGTGK